MRARARGWIRAGELPASAAYHMLPRTPHWHRHPPPTAPPRHPPSPGPVLPAHRAHLSCSASASPATRGWRRRCTLTPRCAPSCSTGSSWWRTSTSRCVRAGMCRAGRHVLCGQACVPARRPWAVCGGRTSLSRPRASVPRLACIYLPIPPTMPPPPPSTFAAVHPPRCSTHLSVPEATEVLVSFTRRGHAYHHRPGSTPPPPPPPHHTGEPYLLAG